MNERIREIWQRAADSAAAFPSGKNTSWETQVTFLDQFAQLIVKECATICKDTSEKQFSPLFSRESDGADVCYRKIKEHFGVKL